ncbi:MAG: DegT/DnrJ/EryC1/StrS family aminotransferase, partial [Pirellulaceae bacterium]|nr:DegT/DnrJ/EryC1/StrS family aminotransferase [Pirellulaceae bacterium]
MTPAAMDNARRSDLPSSVPLLDVNRGNAILRGEILEAIARVVDSGRFLYGPDVSRLEESMAAICDSRYAIGCASGSDALLLALMAYDVGPGDEVIVPSFTFFATASCVWRLGARVVFADIDPVTFNLDPAKVEEAITPATRAIIPVHLYGQCADMEALLEIARHNDVKVIEDAAQAIGAEYRGRPAGSLGDVGCISFYPTKNLGAMGDGGMLVTSDEPLAEKLRRLAAHGMKTRYYHSLVGINSRLDSIQAAVLNVKL